MKKIIIFLWVVMMFSNSVMASCPINIDMKSPKSCTVSLQNQNQTIKDKLLPNNLNQMVNPSRETSREFQRQPHSKPDTINREQYNNPENEEGNKPYNAACQFGVCLPGGTSSGENR